MNLFKATKSTVNTVAWLFPLTHITIFINTLCPELNKSKDDKRQRGVHAEQEREKQTGN